MLLPDFTFCIEYLCRRYSLILPYPLPYSKLSVLPDCPVPCSWAVGPQEVGLAQDIESIIIPLLQSEKTKKKKTILTKCCNGAFVDFLFFLPAEGSVFVWWLTVAVVSYFIDWWSNMAWITLKEWCLDILERFKKTINLCSTKFIKLSWMKVLTDK